MIVSAETDVLADFAARRPPLSLYRFFSPRGASLLTMGRLKVTPFSEFNDPFEFSPGIISAGLTPGDLRGSFLSQDGLPRSVFRTRFASEEKYREWVERTVIPTPELWSQHFDSMRRSVKDASSELFGAACFSAFSRRELSGPVAIRHWSMYARDHSGFAVEFDGRHSLFKAWAARSGSSQYDIFGVGRSFRSLILTTGAATGALQLCGAGPK